MQLTLTTQNARYQRIFFLNNVGEKLRHRRANYKALHTTLGKSNQRFIRPSPPVERWSPQSQPSLIKMSLAINDALNVRQGLCEVGISPAKVSWCSAPPLADMAPSCKRSHAEQAAISAES